MGSPKSLVTERVELSVLQSNPCPSKPEALRQDAEQGGKDKHRWPPGRHESWIASKHQSERDGPGRTAVAEQRRAKAGVMCGLGCEQC